MPNVKILYAVVGKNDGDGWTWATSKYPGMALVMCPDAPPGNAETKLKLLKEQAEILAKIEGREYVIGKYVFQGEV